MGLLGTLRAAAVFRLTRVYSGHSWNEAASSQQCAGWNDNVCFILNIEHLSGLHYEELFCFIGLLSLSVCCLSVPVPLISIPLSRSFVTVGRWSVISGSVSSSALLACLSLSPTLRLPFSSVALRQLALLYAWHDLHTFILVLWWNAGVFLLTSLY